MLMLPVCPEMEVWSDGTNYRYLIKDWHADYVDGRISLRQQADIIWAAQQKKDEGVFVLAEDPYTYCGANKKIKKIYEECLPNTLEMAIANIAKLYFAKPEDAIDSLQICDEQLSPFIGLINACRSHAIRNYNIECSQSIDPYEWALVHSFIFTKQEVINSLLETIEEIRSYSLLKPDYSFFSERVEELKQIATTNNEDKFIEKMKEMRLGLVDAKTMHKLIEWDHIKHGFICEGADHIQKIKDLYLPKLGYKLIKNIGNADVWLKSDDIRISDDDVHMQMLNNALDLRKTFQQIFDQQKQNSISVYLNNYKWSVAISVAAISGLAAWLYWKKNK